MSAITSGNNALNRLTSTATGYKLYQEALKRGVNIKFAENNGDNVMGQFDPKSNTITVENASLEQMVEVLGHEMVHATTKENGNSKNEETSAFIIGEQIAQEAGVNTNAHDASFWQQHVNNAYTGLQSDNGIASALTGLGIGPTGNNSIGANPAIQAADAGAGNAGKVDDAGKVANNPFNNNVNQQNPDNNAMGNFIQIMIQMLNMLLQMMQQFGGNNNLNNKPADDTANKVKAIASEFSLTA